MEPIYTLTGVVIMLYIMQATLLEYAVEVNLVCCFIEKLEQYQTTSRSLF